MTFRLGNLVKETTTTTGTGDLTFLGAPSGYRPFSTICSDGDTVPYAIGNAGDAEREVGLGTWHTGNTLTRTAIIESTNSNNVVSLSSGTKPVYLVMPAEMAGTGNHRADGVLTAASGVTVRTSDVVGATSVYFALYRGNEITLFTGGMWRRYRISELSDALGTLTSGVLYDEFVWDNAGTPTMTKGPAWTAGGGSDTARGTGAGSTELELFEGVWVNKWAISGGPGARAGRYVGSFRTTSTTTTEDSEANMFVASLYNQPSRIGKRVDNGSHTYNSLQRIWNGGTATRVQWIQCFAGYVRIDVHARVTPSVTDTYILPFLDGVVTGAGGSDIGVINGAVHIGLHVASIEVTSAGYHFADVGEYEFVGNNVTNDSGRTFVEIWQ